MGIIVVVVVVPVVVMIAGILVVVCVVVVMVVVVTVVVVVMTRMWPYARTHTTLGAPVQGATILSKTWLLLEGTIRSIFLFFVVRSVIIAWLLLVTFCLHVCFSLVDLFTALARVFPSPVL